MGSIWIGLFAYKHLEYSHELWWQFALSGGDAPRFLRATVGVMVVVLIFSTAKLLQPGSPEPSMPDHKELDRAHDIITDPRPRLQTSLFWETSRFYSARAETRL